MSKKLIFVEKASYIHVFFETTGNRYANESFIGVGGTMYGEFQHKVRSDPFMGGKKRVS